MEKSRVENVNLTAEKQKLEERVKALETEISALQAAKGGPEAAANSAETTKQIADQATTIVRSPLFARFLRLLKFG